MFATTDNAVTPASPRPPTPASPGEPRSSWVGYLLVFLAVTTWSFSEILQKLLQDAVPPMSKSFFRFFIGIIPLFAILVGYRDLEVRGLFRRNWKEFLIAGVVGFGIGNFVYFLGIERTQANLGSAIYGSYPIFISIYSIFVLNERDNLKTRFLGYVVGFVGIIILVTNLDFSGFLAAENFVGNLLVLLGAVIWSWFSVLGKKITRAERDRVRNVDLKMNLITMALAALTNLAFLAFMPDERATFFQYPGDAWGYLIILGVVTTGLGTWLFFVGIQQIEVSKGISLALFKPILVTVFAFFILQEYPPLVLFVSLPIVSAAVYLVTKPAKVKAAVTGKKGNDAVGRVRG